MVIGFAVLDEEALVGSGGDHRDLAHRQHAHIACGVVRVLHGDVPERAVGFETQGLDIAAEGDNAAFHAHIAHGADGVVGGAALGYRAEADGGPGGEGHRVGAGARKAREHHLVKAAAHKVFPKLLVCRHIVAPAVKAPLLDDRVDGEIQRTAALLIDGLRGGEHICHLTRDGDVAAVCVVDGIGGAGLNVGVEHVVHGLNDALRSGETPLGIATVCGERHDGIHGEDLPLRHLCFSAACQGQYHAQTQAQKHQLFERSKLFHRESPLMSKRFPRQSAKRTCHRLESLL